LAAQSGHCIRVARGLLELTVEAPQFGALGSCLPCLGRSFPRHRLDA
jgi:hypothetical protein